MSSPRSELVSIPIPDPALHCSLQLLQERIALQPRAPRDCGSLRLICSRREEETRWLPDECKLDPIEGIPSDRWHRNREAGEAKYGERYSQMQIATMEAGVAELIANGQPPWLFGDNLFLDLDLSKDNLPEGSVLQLGGARVVVTPEPHDGCRKFHARFGADALRFVAERSTRSRNFRGIYLRVLEAGTIAVGDPVRVLSRG